MEKKEINMDEIPEQLKDFDSYLVEKVYNSDYYGAWASKNSLFHFKPEIRIGATYLNLNHTDLKKLHNSEFSRIKVMACEKDHGKLTQLMMNAGNGEEPDYIFDFGTYRSEKKLNRGFEVLRRKIKTGYANGILNFWRLKVVRY